MKTVAIIQARMGSTRLPGKVLKDLVGKPVLERVVERVQKFKLIDELVVATSSAGEDDAIAQFCQQKKIGCVRGSEHDVLSRFCVAARVTSADICVRITADCPLIDAGVSDEIIAAYKNSKPMVDYASNKIPQSFPRGLDTEVFSRKALEITHERATQIYERTHVTIYIYEHPEQFRLLSIRSDVDRAHWRWTLDTPEDLAFVRAVYERLGENFSWRDIVLLVENEMSIGRINAHIPQKHSHDEV